MHESQKTKEDYIIVSVFLDTDSTEWKSTADFFDSFKFDKWDDWIDNEGSDEEVKINVGKFLKKLDDQSFWQYKGSLTEPPCTETVKWFIMKQS